MHLTTHNLSREIHRKESATNPFVRHTAESTTTTTVKNGSTVTAAAAATTTEQMPSPSDRPITAQKKQLLQANLWGRKEEEQALADAYHRITSPEKDKAELVLITGPSGTGKVRVDRHTHLVICPLLTGSFTLLFLNVSLFLLCACTLEPSR